MVRCNLTIILANKKYHDLPEFYKKHQVEVVSSLPFYTADRTDRQRGKGVFEHSIEALKMLNTCLLYTSDAADERSSVDLGGSRIIKKKNNKKRQWDEQVT